MPRQITITWTDKAGQTHTAKFSHAEQAQAFVNRLEKSRDFIEYWWE